MQRYHAASCTSAVNNNTPLGGISNRDSTARGAGGDSSSLSSNFSLNSRRASPLVPYRLKCEKEPLNSRLGPPDFHPQTLNCPEETLTKEYVQTGYRETVEGLEEAKEISVTQVNTFTKPVVVKCKEAIRKRLRAINESRAQKRKAGQVYGEPLSGSLLSKPGVFPEQKSCGEDFKRRWIEGLSQYHKSLRSLADHVPHGYRKKSLFEVLIRNNVPLLRATWFIKVTYLNQIRPGSSSVSSGTPDRIQLSRTEIWTKDVIDYLQCLLDELLSKNNTHSAPQNRDRSQQLLYARSAQQKSDSASLPVDSEEPSLDFKWCYVVRILNWHHAEGLIFPSQVIDWVFLQFQDRDLFKVLQFLLPIIHGVLETITSCQTYVRKLVDITLRFLKEPCLGRSDQIENSQRVYTCSALVEMLQYLILSVPDTFVGLDCFPLPQCMMKSLENDGSVQSMFPVDGEPLKNNSAGVSLVQNDKALDIKCPSSWFRRVVSSIQKRTTYLAKAASPGYSGQNVAKAVQALDKTLVQGSIQEAYKFLFEGLSDSSVHEGWIAEVSPYLRSSLKLIRSVSPPLLYSVFLLCEWCTCDFRDFRTSPPHDVKFTGRRDLSQLYIAVRLLKQKAMEIRKAEKVKKGSERRATGGLYDNNLNWRKLDQSCIETSDFFESPGPLHDIIVCWMDQHEAQKGEGSKRVQLLLIELTRSEIFSPLAYVRQLLVSGIMDEIGPVVDPVKRKRHYRILKQLSASGMHDIFDEAQNADRSLLSEAINIYANERHLLLRGLSGDELKQGRRANIVSKKQKELPISKKDRILPHSTYQLKMLPSLSDVSHSKSQKNGPVIERLKLSISEMLLLPKPATDAGVDESQVNLKRSVGLISSKLDIAEGTPGCEECRKVKRQKLGEEKYSFLQGPSSNSLDDQDNWWARKDPKPLDSVKVDQPIKPSKQASRGRQKSARKTQSLNQLAAARIEGSQGASTSHVCDNKVGCPHHRPVAEGDAPKSAVGNRAANGTDIVSIGKILKRLKFAEKRSISAWVVSSVRQIVEETEKAPTNSGQHNRPVSSVDEKSSARWKLGEDELSVILYLMDMCTEVPRAIKFLIWLLPKSVSNLSTPIHGGRNIMMFPRNVENHACEVKEPFLLSAIRRYENVIVAVDLLPEILSSAMHRAAAVLASNGRLSGSPTFLYARYLLRKYEKVGSVIEWEKNFKATCDKRLLSELESGKLQNGEFGFSFAVPAGVEDLDDFIRQKISGNRLSRTGMNMREIVQKCVDEAVRHLFGKERKLFGPGAQKNAGIDKWDDGYQIAQQIIVGLMDCIRQTGGAAQEGDPSLVSSAVSAIVGNVGPAIAKMPDFTSISNHSNFPAPTGSLSFARRVLRIHINCLCLLKEALGERHSRAFEIALATEASSALAGVLSPGKGGRAQFQLSPDAHDSGINMSNDAPNNSTKVAVGRKIAAAVSALVIGAIIHGVSSLERMVAVFRLKEGLDLVQFVRSSRTHSNGNARSTGALKVENTLEVYIHWFRLFVGNCRTVSDGFIVDLLGEPSLMALSRMQRTLPLNLVLPPAYSLFAFMIWRPFIFNVSTGSREENPQLLQSLTLAIGDALKHAPFRDICLRNTHGFFDLVTSEATDAEFASILEMNGSDRNSKAKAFIPLRARLFLNALVDCTLPHSAPFQDDGNRLSGANDPKSQYGESETKISDRLVRALDTLQPAKFHWQWVELRLFLSEQTLVGKLNSNDTQSVAEAIRSLSPNPDKGGPLENENNIIPIVLSRLLVRPDAAPLLSEVVHLFGRSLEDSMLLHVKWFLEGNDVLFGRKSIWQRLVNVAESKSFSTKAQFWKPWGWCNYTCDATGSRGEKRRFETVSVEEGELVEEDKKHSKGTTKLSDREGLNTNQQFVTERALIELVLPCIDRSSDDSRNRFASELIKQMNSIEQQISGGSSGSSKQSGSSPSGSESSTTKASTRKSLKGSSPGLARRTAAVATDSTPSSPAALRASISLRLQLLVRLLPNICVDGDLSSRSSRFMLASVILRLLGSRIVYEDMDLSFNPGRGSPLKEAELQMETCADVSLDLSGKNLFDWLLLVLHALLSNSQPSWLKLKSSIKTTIASAKEFAGFDRETLENLQSELDRMQLPDTVRRRIQAAMPVLVPKPRTLISCQPPPLLPTAVASLQPSVTHPSNQASPVPKNSVPSVRTATAAAMLGKSKSASSQPDTELEVDPWTVLEDGAGSGPSSSNTAVMGGGDHANLRASSWLKGAIRIRRTDLTYIGAVDDDS